MFPDRSRNPLHAAALRVGRKPTHLPQGSHPPYDALHAHGQSVLGRWRAHNSRSGREGRGGTSVADTVMEVPDVLQGEQAVKWVLSNYGPNASAASGHERPPALREDELRRVRCPAA